MTSHTSRCYPSRNLLHTPTIRVTIQTIQNDSRWGAGESSPKGATDMDKGRIVDGTGHNMFYEGTEGAEAFRSQERLYDYYAKQVAEKQNDKSNE